MKLLPLILLVTIAFASSAVRAVAQSSTADSQILLGCVYQKGATKAGLSRPVGCVGMVSGKCMPENETNADRIECLARETAGWNTILQQSLASLSAKLSKLEASTLRKRQTNWTRKLRHACASEDQGSLAAVEYAYCIQTETAKRAMKVYREAKKN